MAFDPLSFSLFSSSDSPTVEQTQFSDLPNELILEIYRHLHAPAQIITLNRTSRNLYEVWRFNAVSISETVLSHTIECYDAALELFETFHGAEASFRASDMPSSSTLQSDALDYTRTLELNAQLVSNASRASIVGNWYWQADDPSHNDREWVRNPRFEDYPYAKLLERERAIQAFYRLWCMTSPSYSQCKPVASLARAEVYALGEMVLSMIMRPWSGRDLLRLGVVVMDPEDEPHSKSCIFSKHWQEAFSKVICAIEDDSADLEGASYLRGILPLIDLGMPMRG